MTKFYELTTAQRLGQLRSHGVLDNDDLPILTEGSALPTAVASNMVENHIGAFPVPLGLAEHFLIDGERYIVPMAVEEPSVIAAAGNAAQRIASSGGFRTFVERRGITAQIVFADVPETVDLKRFVAEHDTQLHQIAYDAHPSLETHGGGLRSITTHAGAGFAELDLLIDPADAMGANVVNTIAEAIAGYCKQELPELDLLMAILSNNAGTQRARSEVRIDVENLATSAMSGHLVAERIAEAARFAEISPLRAATHNKGIMNGINAVVLATGNDTRNVNAAAYADLDEQRRTWTHWSLDEASGQLVGLIDLPLPLGSVGGAMSVLPAAKIALKILRHPNAERLMSIVVSVGLASNLSAMRALVTKGIQAGHMNLQFKSLAISAGARPDELDAVVASLRADPAHASLRAAKDALSDLRPER